MFDDLEEYIIYPQEIWNMDPYFNNIEDSAFGASIAIDESRNLLFVGAPGRNCMSLWRSSYWEADDTANPPQIQPASMSGSVYVFTLDGGNATFVQQLLGDSTVPGDCFGLSLELYPESETLVVGAPFALSFTGRVFQFSNTGELPTPWLPDSYFPTRTSTVTIAEPGSLYGLSLSMDQTVFVAVGVPGKYDPFLPDMATGNGAIFEITDGTQTASSSVP